MGMSHRGINMRYPFRVDLRWDPSDPKKQEDAYRWMAREVGPGFCYVQENKPWHFAARFKYERHALLFKLSCQ